MRTLSLAGRRLETQLLHYDGVDWHAYTFAWRDDQADADLVPADGAEKEVQRWEAEARVAVPQPQPVHVVPQQLVGIRPGVPAGAIEPAGARRPQPARRPHGGGIHPPGRATDGKPLPPFDADIGRAGTQARRPGRRQPAAGGAGPGLPPRQLRALPCPTAAAGRSICGCSSPVAIAEMKAIGVRPTRGDFGLPDARIIKPGDPVGEHPVLPHGQVRPRSDAAHRLRTTGRSGPGPHRAMDRRDGPGRGKRGPGPGQRAARPVVDQPEVGACGCAKARPRRAGPRRARRVAGRGRRSSRTARSATCSRAICHRTSGRSGSSARTPGPGPSWPSSGDPRRGEKLFWSQPIQCGSCHRIGDRGTPVGPDLSTIGKLRSREDLLDSLLEPSRRIEPKYATYVAATADGVSLTGLLVKRDEKSVVLRDSKGKEIILAAKDVEELRPSRASLMPDGQLADLTAQEAADLIEYLHSLR